MAKYLGGIKDPNIIVIDITRDVFPSDFFIKYRNLRNGSNDLQYCSIYDSIIRFEEVSSEREKKLDLTWGAAGYLVGGVLGALVGATLAGDEEKHVVLFELKNGWSFSAELNKSEYQSLETFMEFRAKYGNSASAG